MSYATFIEAISGTVSEIHSKPSPMSTVNPFTIQQTGDGRYHVEGEAWDFVVAWDAAARVWRIE